jgi:hypothetical protein
VPGPADTFVVIDKLSVAVGEVFPAAASSVAVGSAWVIGRSCPAATVVLASPVIKTLPSVVYASEVTPVVAVESDSPPAPLAVEFVLDEAITDATSASTSTVLPVSTDAPAASVPTVVLAVSPMVSVPESSASTPAPDELSDAVAEPFTATFDSTERSVAAVIAASAPTVAVVVSVSMALLDDCATATNAPPLCSPSELIVSSLFASSAKLPSSEVMVALSAIVAVFVTVSVVLAVEKPTETPP